MAEPGTQRNLSHITLSGEPVGFKPLLFFLRRYRSLALLTLGVSFTVSLLESFNVGMIFPLLMLLLNTTDGSAQTGQLVTLLNRIIGWVPVSDKVVAACVLLIALSLAKFLLSGLAEYLAAYTGGKVLHESRMGLLEKYFQHPYSFFIESRQGDLKHIFLNGSMRVSYCMWIFSLGVTEFLKIAAIVVFLMMLDFRATLVLVSMSFFFYFVTGYLFRNLSYRMGQLFGQRQMEIHNLLDELFTGVKHVLVFEVLPYWFKLLGRNSKAQVAYQVKQRLAITMPKGMLELTALVVFFAVIIGLRWFAPGGLIQAVPMIGLFGLAVIKLLPSLHTVNRSRLDLMNQLPEVDWVYRLLTSHVQETGFGRKPFAEFLDSITLEDIHFAYPGREPVLAGASVVFQKNQVTAIVGRSGEGKTTVINLLLGLYRPQKGSIRVDGVEMKEYDLRSWRRRIGFVPQDPFMFHGTVAENIAFGDDSFTTTQIREAARVANAEEFIASLPNGYETVVGERGMKLSTGQQQRIAIARAVLRNPTILVFDEATSALDNISERLVQEAIFRLSKKSHTVILIAHRLSTIQLSDKIVVLHQGRFVAEGTHDQLASGNGEYSRLLRAEFSEASGAAGNS